MNLTGKVFKLSSIYDAPHKGKKYDHVSCRGCKTDSSTVPIVNYTLISEKEHLFGYTLVSYMRQHFKVAHRHTLSNKEIPTQDHEKGKQQRVEYTEVYSHEDHDLVNEHNIL